MASLLSERGVLRIELLAERGELVLGVVYGAPLVVDCVLHRAEVYGRKPDRDDRRKEERRYSLAYHGST